ncbi:monooxygenase [Legionella taurinensis]|uniref:Monooxygenase n=1 Tax=Legionella taurinensis TaxID=70611 RepID=A0A3A5L3H2_9GAMM|nr:NAD(P)-binding domain-containing protein [Legionella taurinensis]MDX1838654.1 NAD(P)-binding domain-containing protein [Legionella taurinensis]PUT38837.1 monooxygenase [Legionella taurinensis]PUT40165.1 monooxygenase [Legionella taurinensis]PUT42471.1 monooxygenase [Legionella taurinensis]PUT45891.1 monooxygenase [Legionella taurinensis]
MKPGNDSPSICVVGAGPSGITTAKNLLEQGLTNFQVFEKNARLGGNWVFDENNQHSSVYETTHIISSKYLSQFEDFPMLPGYPEYPSHQQILTYFEKYAEHFGIGEYIAFNTTVEKIQLRQDKKWQVIYRNQDGLHEREFDYLLIANGHHWDPRMPEYPGQFSGEILHAHHYKKAAPFKDKRVLVVGGGNSACDIAVEISRLSPKTCISMRRGQHIFPKFIFGKPTDIAFNKIRWIPDWPKQLLAAGIIRILQGRYPKYKLQKPHCRPLAIHPTINSELLYFIRHGKIFPKPGIARFEGNTVHFVDGRQDEFDVIIFATGYQISFPFFDKAFLDYSQLTHIPLYRKMMHATWDNLYFIGLFQPQGCIWPLADYQAKIAAKIIAGTLPRPADLSTKISREIKASRSRFKTSVRHALEVDYQKFRRQLKRELKKATSDLGE